MHDPLAVGVALDQSLVKIKKFYVDIETKSEICDGQTVCDFQNRLSQPPNMYVALEVDSDAFFNLFISTLNKN
jgi:purine nucleosidase